MKLTLINEEHVAIIAGREYKIGFTDAKKLAYGKGATRFEYDGLVWVFRNGKWNIQNEAL